MGDNPLSWVDREGLAASDVDVILDDLQYSIPGVHPTGGWQFGPPTRRADTYTNPNSGQITVSPKYAKPCLTEEEFVSLYFDLLHEGMHSSDPPGTRQWDLFWQFWFDIATSHHQSIYNRATYEEYGVMPPRHMKDGWWGYGPTSNIRPPAIEHVPWLYSTTRPCSCTPQ